MALPPVNIPNVNYGSYARPETVKVDTRGQLAIGQAIAQGFQAAANVVNAKMEANRKVREEGQKKGDIESEKLASQAKSANLLQNTNILRDISADITSFEIQKAKDPSLNYTLEKQQLYGIVDNLNYLEDNVLDALPTDLTKDDFVDRKSFENYDQLRKLKTNETPLEYNKQGRDLTLYLNGQKTGLRDFVDNQDKFDYTKGLKYQIDGNTKLDALGKNFVKIAENYTKVDGNRKVLDYDRAASVVGDFPEIKDIIKNFGENIYNGYLRGDGEAYDPKNKDHVAEVATLLIDRTLSNVPKDFGDVPSIAVEEYKDPRSYTQVLKDANAANRLSVIEDTQIKNPIGPAEQTGEKPKDFGSTLFEPSEKSGMGKPTPFYNDLKVQMSDLGFDIKLEGEIQKEIDGDPYYYPSTIVIKDSFSSQSRTLPLENLTPDIIKNTLSNLAKVNTSFLMSSQQGQGGLPIYNQD